MWRSHNYHSHKQRKMAISVAKKKSKSSKKVESNQYCESLLFKVFHRIPAVIFVLTLIFLWSSSTTIITRNVVSVCVSSRKLTNLCLSAGTHPHMEYPAPDIIPSPSGQDIANVSDNGDNAPSLKTDDFVNDFVREEHPGAVIRANIGNDHVDGEIENAKKVVEGYIQMQRSWTSEHKDEAACDGKGIYVYDLPSKFNKDLVGQCGDMMPWSPNFCSYFDNEALGEALPEAGKGWYRTHQYSLELIFHSRVLKHPCRVYNEDEAKLFYVPFYGGLDILRWHFKNVSNDVRDTMSLELVKWLESRKPWVKNSGKDHVFVLGKISWDFRRASNGSWGTRLLDFEQMQNPIKLLIERQPWHINDIGIPHPTYFHPSSDDDILNWQYKMIKSRRKSLVSFAGAARPDQHESIRSVLINQCISHSNNGTCKFQNCSSGGCDNPKLVIDLFSESEFCLQPPGDSPTRKSVFDSLVLGCIPVLFDPFTAYYQYPWHLTEDHTKYSVFIDQDEVRQMKVNVIEKLMNVSEKERQNMRRYIVYELLPELVYAYPNAKLERFQDAFSVTMNNLFERVSKLD